MSRTTRTLRSVLALTLGATVATACGGGGESTSPTASITLAIDTAATVVQGGAATLTATVSRTNFSGDVSLSAVGTLPGVSIAFNPSTLSGGTNASTLTISADQSAAVGSNTITIRASGSGITDGTATFRLQVAAPFASGVTATPESLAVPATTAAIAALRIDRSGGVTGPVTLTADVPDGISVAFDQNPVAGDTTVVTVAVEARVPPGRHEVPFSATTPTMTSPRTGTLVLTVTDRPAPNVNFSLCGDPTERPIWFVAQDGAGPWTVYQPDADGAYAFHIDEKGAVGYVTQNGPDDFDITALYATKAQLEDVGADCIQPPPGRPVTATILGVGPNELATVSLGGRTGIVTAGQSTVTLADVPNGPLDLLAARSTLPSQTPNALFLQHGLTIPGGTLPPIDFNDPAQTVAPASDSVRLTGQGSDSSFVDSYFSTTSTYMMLVGKDPLSTASTHVYYTVPLGLQLPGDLTTVAGRATEIQGGVAVATRTAQATFSGLGSRSLTFGPALRTPTVDVVAGSIQISATLQQQYNKFYSGLFTQTSGTSVRSVYVGATTAYLERADFLIVMPDFKRIGPFNPNWALRLGVPTTWLATAWGWSGNVGVFAPPILDGVRVHTAARTGTITP